MGCKRLVLVCVIFTIAIFTLMGCQKPPAQNPPAKTADQAVAPVEKPAGGELTIFSWWTAGGEADGLNELIKMFNAEYPGIKLVNAAVAGGAGTNAKAVLKTRMLGGNPPDTFQVHGGAELLQTWVRPGLMAPINSLYEKENWMSAFPKALLDMVSKDGKIYAVPSNVHRGNALWYNKELLEKNDITPPATFDEWIAACEKLKKAGVTPLALGSRNKWPVTHLFENLLAAAGGSEFYYDLFAGKIPWTDDRVKKALTYLKTLLDYVNNDHSALTWDQACGLVQEGKAAMNVMGDWAKGYFLAQGAVAKTQFDAVPTPGTVKMFFVITDTFGLPDKAENPEAALAFLKIVGSEKGQAAFNPKKGSIPARLNVPEGGFDLISRQFMADFAQDTLLPSCAHGSAVNEQFVTALNDQLSVFISEKDVDKTAAAIEFIAKDSGVRPE